MHTDLVPAQKLPFAAKHLKQLMYVMMNMPHNRSLATGGSNVLEVGFGKDSNSIFLRALKPSGVNFFAVDVVPAHVQHAKKYVANLGFDDNIEFHLGDVGNMPCRDNGEHVRLDFRNRELLSYGHGQECGGVSQLCFQEFKPRGEDTLQCERRDEREWVM
jgi:SAM-dependent methyltransferase